MSSGPAKDYRKARKEYERLKSSYDKFGERVNGIYSTRVEPILRRLD